MSMSSSPTSRRMSIVARKNPERTKNTSTATNAPLSHETPAWNPTTSSTARPRRPSISVRRVGAEGGGGEDIGDPYGRETGKVLRDQSPDGLGIGGAALKRP